MSKYSVYSKTVEEAAQEFIFMNNRFIKLSYNGVVQRGMSTYKAACAMIHAFRVQEQLLQRGLVILSISAAIKNEYIDVKINNI